MLRLEDNRLVIEIEASIPEYTASLLMRSLVYAIGVIDKDLVSREEDCIYTLCDFLQELLPDEEALKKMRQKACGE